MPAHRAAVASFDWAVLVEYGWAMPSNLSLVLCKARWWNRALMLTAGREFVAIREARPSMPGIAKLRWLSVGVSAWVPCEAGTEETYPWFGEGGFHFTPNCQGKSRRKLAQAPATWRSSGAC